MDPGKIAFGAPGDEPFWAHADKDAVGTAWNPASRVWFTTWRGVLTEVFYPTADRPQLRELQFFISNGEFLHEEQKDLDCHVERIPGSQGYKIQRKSPDGAYSFEKEIIADPDQSCVLQRASFSGQISGLRCYVVCNPHLEVGGADNNAQVIHSGDRFVLAASKNDRSLVLAAEPAFERLSCGYVGRSDGATDLRQHRRMQWEFEKAEHGNVSLTGEIDIARHPDFTIVLGFGETLHAAVSAALHSISVPFAEKRQRFVQGWQMNRDVDDRLSPATGDGGRLFRNSRDILVVHKDKTYLGAFVAALSVPFGEVRTDEDGKGGYHLVWPRDVVNSATALLAIGDRRTPLETLIYLAVAQREDGSFAQNFWVDGQPCWSGLQLDEVTYPIILAYRLKQNGALNAFDPLQMVLNAAEYIVHRGPITPQERWEQLSGYSPSTFAVVIAALICSASFARDAGYASAADFLCTYADYLVDHLRDWTVTDNGDLHPEIRHHFIRINPAPPGDASQASPDDAIVHLPNQRPGSREDYPARNVVDAGFLHLVRYGILAPDDPLIIDSIKVVDHVLKVETPFGPCWRRFNHDGYGPRDDGAPYHAWGCGRAWPLLTGERGHYELAAHHDARPYLLTMERLATSTALLAEQVWDQPIELHGRQMFGRPVASAVPLAWAHAEYLKLALSIQNGAVLDRIPEVANRYLHSKQRNRTTMWTLHYQVNSAKAGETLRIYTDRPFRLRYSLTNWVDMHDEDATETGIDVYYTDLQLAPDQSAPIRFTFLWKDSGAWQGCDYSVQIAR